MNLTKDFTLEEMQCPCGRCNGGMMDEHFMARLQRLRDLVGQPFKITSGYRCSEHNIAVGGSVTSLHLQGRAADIEIPDLPESLELVRFPFELLVNAHDAELYGVGVGNSLIHVDDRADKALWFYTDR